MKKLTDEEIKARIARKVKKLYQNKKKKYNCEFCGSGFNKRDFLISHMKIRHPDDYDLKYGETNYASLNPNSLGKIGAKIDKNQSGGISQPVNADSSGSQPIKKPLISQPSVQPNLSQQQQQPSAQTTIKPLSTPLPTKISDKSSQISMSSSQSSFSNQTIPPISLDDLDNKLGDLNSSLGRTMKVMKGNMKMLNKELQYLICEYKSPFIIFD